MADNLAPGPRHRESEFVYDPRQGVWLTGTCGVVSCAMAEWCATGNETHTLDTYYRMRAGGWCAPNGASASTDWLAYLQSRGLKIADTHLYAGDAWSEYGSFLSAWAGRAVTVMELARGQALKDAVSGCGENARNLQYHIICIYGTGIYNNIEGVWCADGDNFAAGDVLQFYSWDVLAAAMPCAAVAVAVEASAMVPSGWHDDGTTLTAPNGVPVVRGFREWVLAHNWEADDFPLAPEQEVTGLEPGNPAMGSGVRQDFRMTSLGWSSAHPVYRIWTGQDIRALQAEIAALRAQPPVTTPAQLTPYQQACIAFAESAFATSSAQSSAAALRGK